MAELPRYFYFRITPVTVKGFLDRVMVEDASDVDVVEVVRCKDCQHYNPEATEWRCDIVTGLVEPCDGDFCSYGERRKEATP